MRPRGSPSLVFFQGHFKSRDFRDLQQRSKSGIAKVCKSFELECISCFCICLQFCCLMYTFSLQKPSKKQQKLSVLSCLQKLCRKQLPGLSSSVCRSCPNLLQKLFVGL